MEASHGERARFPSTSWTSTAETTLHVKRLADAEPDLAAYQVAYTWDMDLAGLCIVADYIERGITWSPTTGAPSTALSVLYRDLASFAHVLWRRAGRSIRGVEAPATGFSTPLA